MQQEERQKPTARQPKKKTSKKSLQASEQPRRQAIERTRASAGKSAGVQQQPAGSKPAAATAAADAEPETATAPAVATEATTGTDMPKVVQKQPLAVPGRLPPLQGGHTPPRKGAVAPRPAVEGVSAGGTAAGDAKGQPEGGSSTAPAWPDSVPAQPKTVTSKRKPGSRRNRRKPPPTKVQRLPDMSPTLFGSNPHLRVVGGKVPDGDA